MSKKANVMATPVPWNMVAEGYVETTMKMLSGYSVEALESANLTSDMKILDVACGPGTFSLLAANRVAEIHAIDFSEPMLSLMQREMEKQGASNISCRHGDGQELPFDDESFDAAFSMFGLMFFPDRIKGFTEMHRVLKPGGRVAVTSWAPVDCSPAMRTMFGALRAMNPDMPEPQRAVESLENPDVFEKELAKAGFQNVEIRSVTKDFPVNTIEDFWRDMVKGSAPLVMMKNNVGEQVWAEKEKVAIQYLKETIPSVPTALSSDAWLGIAEK